MDKNTKPLTAIQTFKSLAITGLAIASMSVGLNAQAKTDQYTVTYSHAELVSTKGVETVHARIVKAAKHYCPTYSQIRSQLEVRSCIADVVTDLVGKVDHPVLTSFHENGSTVSIAKR